MLQSVFTNALFLHNLIYPFQIYEDSIVLQSVFTNARERLQKEGFQMSSDESSDDDDDDDNDQEEEDEEDSMCWQLLLISDLFCHLLLEK